MCSLSLTELKDIITIIVSITATVIAYLGLRTWRKKLLGENKFELSINVIKSLRILIDEIENFRSPLYLANEIYAAYYEVEKKDLNSLELVEYNKAQKYAQNLRWKTVISSYIEYNSKILHLKVILDNFDLDLFENETMTSLINKIRNSIFTQEHYIELLKPGITQSEEERNKYIKILKDNGSIFSKHDKNNEFSKTLENYFLEIKKRLNKYLK